MAGKFNDADLRKYALKLKDPYDQPELLSVIPEGATLLDIVNVYTFERWPAEKVFCAECKGRHHKMGFTALLATGNRILLGSTCGARLFGESWKAAEKRINERSERQYELKRLDRFALIVAPLRDGLLHWSTAMDRVLRKLTAFNGQLGELASRTREAASQHGGSLTVVRRTENRAARAAGLQDLGNYENVRVGTLSGSALFTPLDPVRAVDRALDAIDRMGLGLHDSDLTWTTELVKRRKAFERTFSDLEAAAAMYAAAQDFFTMDNFRRLVEWANEHRATEARYEIDAKSSIVRDEEKPLGGIRISPIDDLSEEPLELIKEYRRAD